MRILAVFVCVVTFPSFSSAFERPSLVQIAVTRSGFSLELDWDRDPGFAKNTAAEFEVHIADKCFAMPPGGKDNSLSVRLSDTNLPGDLYKDVWNYYQPADSLEAAGDVWRGCHDFLVAGWLLFPGHFKSLGSISDNNEGNFAVGIKDASLLRKGKYFVTYELSPTSLTGAPPACSSLVVDSSEVAILRMCTRHIADHAKTIGDVKKMQRDWRARGSLESINESGEHEFLALGIDGLAYK